MTEQNNTTKRNSTKEVSTNKLKYIMKNSTYLRYLIILLSVFVILAITNLVIMLLPIDPDILNQKFPSSFIFIILALVVLMVSFLIYMLPLLVLIFKIKKTDAQIEIKEEQMNTMMIPGIVVFALGVIVNIMAIIRYFV
ncbi:MAG: hypothetical protein KGD64_03030 [Candidatus Heimdallarchaeota archaeon]|nr:hypothetical protein [Candidatus Heimdallarchaeota archaeon]